MQVGRSAKAPSKWSAGAPSAVSSSRSSRCATAASRSCQARTAVRSSGSAAGHWLGPSSHRYAGSPGPTSTAGRSAPTSSWSRQSERPPVSSWPIRVYPRKCGEFRLLSASRSASGRAKNARVSSMIRAISRSSTPCPVRWRKPTSRAAASRSRWNASRVRGSSAAERSMTGRAWGTGAFEAGMAMAFRFACGHGPATRRTGDTAREGRRLERAGKARPPQDRWRGKSVLTRTAHGRDAHVVHVPAHHEKSHRHSVTRVRRHRPEAPATPSGRPPVTLRSPAEPRSAQR